MTVSTIKETKRGRYALFVTEDGVENFMFSVDIETLVRHGLKEGVSITEQDLTAIRGASDFNKAKEKAIDYLVRRQHSKRELLQKMCRHFDEDTAQAVVALVQEIGLQSDEDFAFKRASSMAQKNKSTMQILQDLASKGIDRHTAQLAVQDIEQDSASEGEKCLLIVQKNYMSKLQNGKAENVRAALMRRGFCFSIADEAVKTALAEIGEAQEEQDYY